MEGEAADAIAEALIGEFGSLPELLAASPEQHRRMGINDQTAAVLAATRNVVRRVTTARLESRPLLTRLNDLHAYLRAHIGYERVETVRVLYLDAARRLVADEEAGRGGPEEAPFYVRTILGRALEIGAAAVVVAHNHPSGVMRASDADIAITRHLAQAASVVGVALLDHVVVTRAGCLSIMAQVTGAPPFHEIRRRPAAIVASAEAHAGMADRVSLSAVARCLPQRPEDEARERRRLSVAVRAVIRQRRERDALFPPGLFCDPCWNILLDLFACELEGAAVSVKSACLAADVPTSTAFRWIETLCEKGVLSRWKDPHDRRRSYLGLSVDGRAAMIAYADLARL